MDWIDDADLIELEPIAPGGWTVPLRLQSAAAAALAVQFLVATLGVVFTWASGTMPGWVAVLIGVPLAGFAGAMGWVAGVLAEEGVRTGT